MEKCSGEILLAKICPACRQGLISRLRLASSHVPVNRVAAVHWLIQGAEAGCALTLPDKCLRLATNGFEEITGHVLERDF